LIWDKKCIAANADSVRRDAIFVLNRFAGLIMWEALFWGLVSTSSLVLGGIIGVTISIGKRPLGLVMAFGAGVLISAVAYELVYESIEIGKGTGGPTLGLALGALTFFFADRIISNMGASDRKAINPAAGSALVIPMLLGIMLDGVPESVVIGLGILEGGTVSLAMLVAVFISNLPEAIAGTSGMRASGWSTVKILSLWLGIAVFCAFATVGGYALFGNASPFVLAFVQAFAAGAILTMLANSMMPEAFEHGGTLAGLVTVLGFSVSVMVVLMERAG
jgi:ZIP family zinc transporter